MAEIPYSPIDAKVANVAKKLDAAERKILEPVLKQLDNLDKAKTGARELTQDDKDNLQRMSKTYEPERNAARMLLRQTGNGDNPAQELEDFLSGNGLDEAEKAYFKTQTPAPARKMMFRYYVQQGAARKQVRDLQSEGINITELPSDWQANMTYLQVHPDFPEPEAGGYEWKAGQARDAGNTAASSSVTPPELTSVLTRLADALGAPANGSRGGGRGDGMSSADTSGGRIDTMPPAHNGDEPEVQMLAQGGEILVSNPKDMLQLSEWVRNYVTRIIFEGRTKSSPATMESLVRIYLEHFKGDPRNRHLVEQFVNEAGAVQRFLDLGDAFSKRGGTNDGLKEIGNAVAGGDYEISVYRLNKLKGWVDTRVPEHLQGCYGGRESASMSEMLDRNLMMYVGFLGEWADASGDMWRQAIKEEDDAIRHRRTNRGDPKAWGKHIEDAYKRKREAFEAENLHVIEAKYLKMLNIPTDRSGRIDGNFLHAALSDALVVKDQNTDPEYEKNLGKDEYFKVVFDAIKNKRNISLAELFGKKNIFDDSMPSAARRWTREVISALGGGGDYASYLALNVVEGTGEAGQLNTTEESGGYDAGAMPHLAHFRVRQITEAVTGAPVGSRHTVGRFPSLIKSLMRYTQVDGKNIVDHIRGGARFTELPWNKMTSEPGVMWGVILMNRSISTQEAILKAPALDYNKDLSVDGLANFVKPFNAAFAGFGGQELTYTGNEGKDREKDLKLWGIRESWAFKHLKPNKAPKDAQVGSLDMLGDDEWSPWFTWALGTIMAHAPGKGLLPEALWPKAGIQPEPVKERSLTWDFRYPIYRKKGLSVEREERPLIVNSIPGFLDRLHESRLLTPNEILLLAATIKEVIVPSWPKPVKLDFAYDPNRKN